MFDAWLRVIWECSRERLWKIYSIRWSCHWKLVLHFMDSPAYITAYHVPCLYWKLCAFGEDFKLFFWKFFSRSYNTVYIISLQCPSVLILHILQWCVYHISCSNISAGPICSRLAVLRFTAGVIYLLILQWDLRGSSADCREILPHDWKLAAFYNPGLKIWGSLPKTV